MICVRRPPVNANEFRQRQPVPEIRSVSVRADRNG
jgi:hypothetical protein